MPAQQWICASGAIGREMDWREAEIIFSIFAHEDFALWLDASDTTHPMGRYSYIGVRPFEKIIIHAPTTEKNADPFNHVKNKLAAYQENWHGLPNHLPPFRGGAAGFFAYDLGRALENLPARICTNKTPDLAIGLYDLILAFDHQQKRSFLFSSGFPKTTIAARTAHALARADAIEEKIKHLPPSLARPDTPTPPLAQKVKSDISPAAYQKNVQKIIDAIHAGEIFQANLSQRFTATLNAADSDFAFYQRLRRTAPAPMSAFARYGDMALLSASPERFLSCAQNQIETRPIKGTAPRHPDPAQDKAARTALLADPKERAENIMIVDLLRSDLSRSCQPHSISVAQLCALESFSTVHHLVSTLRGTLAQNQTPLDALRAAFPGGSISGAPKIRAMEIIDALEPHKRGAYCGALGYIGFDGTMDTNILIRTAIVQNKKVQFQVGGGITAHSQPQAEYLETLAKAQGILAALGCAPIEAEAEAESRAI